MLDNLRFLSVTDKDIFDLLMSSKQRLTEKTLSEMFIERGVLFSPETSRFDLCQHISKIPHDRKSVIHMIEMREAASRLEKRAFVTLPIVLSTNEVDEAVNAYRRSPGVTDNITTQSRRANGAYFNVEYRETDYSKTRLMQSQKRDAGIEISVEGNRTIIRMPATDKALDVVEAIRKEIEKIKLQNIVPENISVAGLTPEQRTNFFMKLIRGIFGYNLSNVMGMKVSSQQNDEEVNLEFDIDPDGTVGGELLSKVNRVALSGMNLLQTEEYQTLLRNGFFLTAVTWRAQQIEKPYDIIQFDAAFKNGAEGTGYRFNARIARRLKKTNESTNDFIPIVESRRPAIWKLIESASQEVLKAVRDGENGVGVAE